MHYESQKRHILDYWKSSGLVTGKAVIRAFQSVPRELFVPDNYRGQAYGDYPLPIPAGQTISQPTTVMIITQALELGKGMKVLEVGAGSGYQAAVIAQIVGKKGRVYATEIIPELAAFAAANLKRAGISNVEVINWDGSRGYGPAAPYDRIVVSAACREIPSPLIEELKDGGILVAPVGPSFGQVLTRVRKCDGKLSYEPLGDFMFVPLTGGHG